jgi:hypothetical protein
MVVVKEIQSLKTSVGIPLFGRQFNPMFFLFAGSTSTKYLHPVSEDGEFMLFCQAFLQLFDHRTHYFDDFAAFKAD